MYMIFTALTRVVKKDTIATCVNKSKNPNIQIEINRRLDVEVNIIESNMIFGISRRVIRNVAENAPDGNTEVDESRQDMFYR